MSVPGSTVGVYGMLFVVEKNNDVEQMTVGTPTLSSTLHILYCCCTTAPGVGRNTTGELCEIPIKPQSNNGSIHSSSSGVASKLVIVQASGAHQSINQSATDT